MPLEPACASACLAQALLGHAAATVRVGLPGSSGL